jgi:hypothetical protein
VPQLFDIIGLSAFADDNFIVRWNPNLEALKEEISTTLNIIIKWINSSRLKVNQSKTDVCIFHRNSSPVKQIMIDGILLKTRDSINVLGVEFDSNLQYPNHVVKTIKSNVKHDIQSKFKKKYVFQKWN